jgi:hypothetical protein
MFGVSAALVFGVIQRLVPASLRISVGERLVGAFTNPRPTRTEVAAPDRHKPNETGPLRMKVQRGALGSPSRCSTTALGSRAHFLKILNRELASFASVARGAIGCTGSPSTHAASWSVPPKRRSAQRPAQPTSTMSPGGVHAVRSARLSRIRIVGSGTAARVLPQGGGARSAIRQFLTLA